VQYSISFSKREIDWLIDIINIKYKNKVGDPLRRRRRRRTT